MTAIEFRNVRKTFDIYPSPIERLKELLWIRSRKEIFTAVDDVTFDIQKGEAFGIIGQNGSGKSTILQMLAGILTPSQGQILVDGRVAALLELGAGFNPEFTGRDNVFLNGALMGLGRSEMISRMDIIERFAEIGDFIDRPVKTYSSGMYVRLAFASAINVEPDILVVDEALAVGDTYFQLKCIKKIKEFREAGKTIVYVTHDTQSVKNICDRAMWIHNGKMRFLGSATEAVDRYGDFMRERSATMETKVGGALDARSDNGSIAMNNITTPESSKAGTIDVVRLNDVDIIGGELHSIHYGGDLVVDVNFSIFVDVSSAVFGVAFFDSGGHYVCGLNTKIDEVFIAGKPGVGRVRLRLPNIRLCPGTYSIDVGLYEKNGVVNLDYKKQICSILVVSEKYYGEGTVILEHAWEV